MMTNLILSTSFKRAFKTIIKRRPDLKIKEDPYSPILRTHKLKGKLSGA
jgi:mRNA-degrading endonuclease YafQ of YafQ-DinJ toxin-antitoxin module